uniref:protein-tyrosine-phosphatase n=1 Tax=Hucho hucho TaxID=62062 RepID=A0A4W5LXT8_9TELE
GVASFVCQATGDPPPNIVWNKKGKKVQNQRFEVIDYEDGSGSVLRIQPLRTPRDEAVYECHVSNPAGEITALCRLNVLRGERTLTHYTHLRYSRRVSLCALQIELSEEQDQGKYECVATNSDGTRYSTPANLYVRVRRVPPRFSVPPADSEIIPGGGINITCVAVGSPMPYVKWMLGTEDLTPEDDMPIGRNVLELGDIHQSNNYTCVAMSTLGVIEAMAQITVKALPKTPGNPVVTERTATSITLTWDSGNPEPVSYYIIQHRPKGSEDIYKEIDSITTTRYSVGGLSPYSHYDFRVAAVNTIGRGPASDSVEARTAEQAPSSPPRQVLKITSLYRVPDIVLHSTRFLIYYSPSLYRCIVGNVVSTLSLPVPSQPSDFKGEAKSETSILLSWVAPPQSGPENQITGYELVYRRSGDNEEKKLNFDPTSSYLMKNLKPFSSYTFQLAARSKHGIGAYTNEVTTDTPQTQPSAPPQEVTCSSPSSTSILVSWAPPLAEFQNGIITGYSIQYSVTEGDNRTSQQVSQIPPESSPYLLENLEKWTEYGITVRALTEAGEGPESLQLLVRTDEDVPSGPPRDVATEAVNSSAVRVVWRAPAVERQHGQVRGYQVHYVKMNYGEPTGPNLIKDILIDDSQWEYNESAEYEVVLGELQADTAYSVSVGAYTAKGDGARSKPQTLCTTLALPERPRLSVSPTPAGTAQLQWLPPPSPPTPLLGYRLTFGRLDVLPLTVVEFPTKEKSYTAQDIHKGALYVFRLSARNKIGYGEEAAIEVTTLEDVPGGYPENILSEGASASSIQLVWKSVPLIEQNGKIVKYSVKYRDVNGRGGNATGEVVVTVPESSVTLEGLSADTVYDVRVCAFTAVGAGPYSPGVQFRTQPLDILYDKGQSVEVDGKQSQKLITGLQPETQYSFLLTNRGNSAGGLQHRVTVTTAPDVLRSKPTLVGKTNADGMVTVQLPPVQTTTTIRGYYVVVVPLKKQRGGKFLKPWDNPDQMNLDESVDPGQQFTWEQSNLEVNKPKNRYANVIAYDHSRINTSIWINIWLYMDKYIDKYIYMDKYMSFTPSDVVSLSLQVKCDQYWPTRGTETYGLIQVTLLDTVELATYSVRTFALYKSGSNEKREIRQFQFTAWPDHGVPEHPTPFLAFLRRVKACNPPDAGPMVVHCSAGVGRTGCFIVIDAMVERIKQEKTVDIYGHVTLMRSQRNYMVQTEDQYAFIHDALLEAVACGNTEVPARNLHAYIQRLTQIEPVENVTGMELEFKVRCKKVLEFCGAVLGKFVSVRSRASVPPCPAPLSRYVETMYLMLSGQEEYNMLTSWHVILFFLAR